MDDEEDATLQQLPRPLDHVPDSDGAAGGAQSAQRLRGPVQTIPAWEEDECGTGQLGKVGGFSLHAGVAVNTRERKKLERICRTISRPALSEARLELTDQGMVSYVGAALKTAYRDGTTGRQSDTLCSSLWISWPNWQHWCPSLEQILRGRLRTISWSTGAEQSVPRERDTAQCSQGRACQR